MMNRRDFWLPKLARGEKIGCFGLTEPDYGSNPGGMVTKAEKIAGASDLMVPKCGLPMVL